MDQQFEQRLQHCTQLPSLPTVVMQLIEVAGSDDLEPEQITDIISKDPALAAKVIRVANSPLFGQRQKTHSIQQAVIKLGINAVFSLALTFSLSMHLRQRATPGLDSNRLWRRAFIASIAARTLGRLRQLNNTEELFLAALLQDIGVLALYSVCEQDYAQLLQEVKTHQDILRVERQSFHTDHTEVGHWLLHHWRFPELLCRAVQSSDDLAILEANEETAQFLSIVAISGRIADIWLLGNTRQAAFAAMIANQKLMQLTDADFQFLLDEVSRQMDDYSQLFEVELISSQYAAQIQASAAEVLAIRNITLVREIRQERQRAELLQEKNRSLEEQIKRDSLTGLYNRHYLDRILPMEFEEANQNNWPLTLFFIDLDHFKQVNDAHGHRTGDELLKAIARYLQRELRRSDIITRYGGEEFVVLLPGTNEEDGYQLADRLRQGIHSIEVTSERGDTVSVTTSIGVACHSELHPFVDADMLVRAADKVLYAAKEEGRNRVLRHKH
ncbi:sensor domain-containing diguanylate cyclase [Balneatrix alpica]|uniref:diguanylate cyclase n=1 Tax=Balneatrix alpica TaxID=75684 RepID=A0ABV5Z8P3_9GAMM|nr:GGDEF domain-containing protein [Balneatrix alpica]